MLDRSAASFRRLSRMRLVLARSPRALGAAASFFGGFPWFGRRQMDAGSPRFRQADGDRLLGRASAMLALANVLDFLAYEFARLRRRRLALAFIAFGPLECFLFGHG